MCKSVFRPRVFFYAVWADLMPYFLLTAKDNILHLLWEQEQFLDKHLKGK